MDWQNLYRKSHSKEYREYHRKWKASSKGYTIGLGAQLVMSRLGITADTMREHYAKLTAEPEKVTDFISI
ncbi:MAG: hypothetical protein GY861_00895 [bacterium]|nr:hypothetical protein [bacterium]